MAALERLAEGVKIAEEVLAEPILEPDPARTDWAEASVRVAFLERVLREKVLEPLAEALEEAEPSARAGVRRRVATLLQQAAAVLHASGGATGADRLLARAADLGAGEQREEAEAARREPALACRLEHGFWLLQHGKDGSRAFREVRAGAQQPALRRAAEAALSAPRPIKRAPTLFRLNGIGVGLYGHRDEQPDGSYVATYCFSVLWIPVLPLTAYRVRRLDSNTYQFLARVPLGRTARVWRAAALAAAVAAGAWAGVDAYRTSPGYLARQGTARAKAAEQAGDRVVALESYRRVVADFQGKADVSEAALGVVRLTVASLPRPCTPAAAPVAGRVVAAFEALPPGARRGTPTTLLASALASCVQEIGDATVETTRAGLEVLDLAARVADPATQASVERQRLDRRLGLAGRLAPDRPFEALIHYAQLLKDKRALVAAGAILESFGDDHARWLEAETEALAWADAARDPELAPAVTRAREALARARAASESETALVASGDTRRLEAALASRPGDADLAAAVAAARRERGDTPGCLGVLRALGPAGRLPARPRRLLGQCLADTGDLAGADAVLQAYLEDRLAIFQLARRRYSQAATDLENRLIRQGQQDQAPADLEQALGAAKTDADKRAAFQRWLSQRMDADVQLSRLRADYLRHAEIVPASLTLGMVRLRRASDASGAERAALLGGAESAFLSIREEAEGAPAFHLGLGQVYHRLGKAKEGDHELQALVDRGDPALTLEVASAYRDLGLTTRAREIAERLYKSSAEPAWRQEAAHLVALIATDLDDEATWLSRSDQVSPEIRMSLREVEGRRALRDGNYAVADKAFAEVAAYHDRQSSHNAVAANNAAVAFMGRYAATGDPAQLEGAAKRLETATRLLPDNAIQLGNLATTLQSLGVVTVLERWIRTRPLQLEGSEARDAIESLLRGPLHDAAVQALEAEPRLRHALEVAQQQQVLAPRQPDGYWLLLKWHAWRADEAGLAALLRQVEGAGAFDVEARRREVEKFRSGAEDAKRRAEFGKGVARCRERIRRAEATRHDPTIAVAYMLLGDALTTATYLDPSEAAFDSATDAYRRAAGLWPEGGFEVDLSNALITAAAYRVRARSAALKEAWDRDWRIYPSLLLLHRVVTAPKGAEALAALRGENALAEGARLRHGRAGARPQVNDWIVGRLAGDVELERKAAAVFSRRVVLLESQIGARLWPNEASTLELELLKRGAAGS